MSSTLRQPSAALSARKRPAAPSWYQASAPSAAKAAMIRSSTASSRRISALPSGRSRTKMAIGTPQARWRDTTQSGRFAIMPVMRFSPAAGTHRVSAMAPSATPRSVSGALPPWPSPAGRDGAPGTAKGWSMAMNHCGVLRKMTGFFERQLCG